MKRNATIAWLVAFTVLLILGTQITIFVIPPLGAAPEGRTLIISKLAKTEFVDSPDAMCNRVQGGVSLLCRAMAMAAVGNNATIYARLPYSEWLYLHSTGGKAYTKPREGL